jgi:CheY-like chemotaxis protein
MGSTFTIHLPQVQSFHVESQDISPSYGKDVLLKFEPATILAVDDVQANLDLLITLFGNQPISFSTALDGREAVLKAETVKPDLILMDIRMPEMDGIAASKKIKSVNKSIPIIACTASLLGGEKDLDIFNAILFKPLQRSKLMETVGRFLPHRELDISTPKPEQTEIPVGAFDMEHIMALRVPFGEKFYDRIKRLLEVIDVNEMEILVMDLKEFTGAHQLESVYPLVSALTSHVERFELDLITEDLKNLLNLFGLKAD